MNHALLVGEIDKIVGLLRDRLAASAENAGYVLSEHFFKTPDLFGSGKPEVGSLKPAAGSIGQANKNQLNQAISQGQAAVQQKKSQRQESIISVLKGQSNITIKDFSKVIKDCSEKTIQRELSAMVQAGLVKKMGEKRWSRYSLA